MLFDTWAGLLGPRGCPYLRAAVCAAACWSGARGGRRRSARGVPLIYYAGDSAGWIEACTEIGADVIGLDWRVGLDAARARVGTGVALQGNLDPTILLGPRTLIQQRTRDVLRAARGLTAGDAEAAAPAPGHIFNLGHGILPQTPPDHARLLVDSVRRVLWRSAHERCAATALSPPPRRAERDVGARSRRRSTCCAGTTSPGRATPRTRPLWSSTTDSARATTASAWPDAARSPGDPLSLYIHLPFCHERCSFCGCMVIITKKHEVAARYLEFLGRETAMLADALAGRRRVVQYHWGGGTPTYLTLAEMEALHGDCGAALRGAARRRGRDRSGSAGHVDRAAGAAAAARVQPRVLRRAGLHARGAGGGQPRPARGPDPPALRRRPAARVRVDQHRPDLRAAAADARVVRPRGRHRRVDAARSRGRVLVRRTCPGFAATRSASTRRCCRRASASWSCSAS